MHTARDNSNVSSWRDSLLKLWESLPPWPLPPVQTARVDLAELEDRVFLSATPLPMDLPFGVAEAGSPAEAAAVVPDKAFAFSNAPTALEAVAEDPPSESPHDPLDTSFPLLNSVQGGEVMRREVVFVDAGVADYQGLLNDLLEDRNREAREITVHFLDAGLDGIQQISDVLESTSELDAVHLLSHGTTGQVKLGNLWLTMDVLTNRARDIADWNGSLRDGADLLIYGCDLAADEDGKALTTALGRLCNCDVAASDDATGNARLGADWELEYSTGRIETSIVVSQVGQQGWHGTLQASLDGGEFSVNTSTPNSQGTAFENRRSVANDADGNSVVVWHSWNQDGDGFGVFGQRFDADGNPQGLEFQVNTATANQQRRAAVAMNATGEFVVVWDSLGQDGSGSGIFAQRYDAAGNRIGGEFQVNTETTNEQVYASIAMDDTGNFVVTWSSMDQDGDSMGVFAQRYDAAGNTIGGEFQVNTFTAGLQRFSTAAMDADGDFVIVWTSGNQDGSGNGIFAQRYDSTGAAQGPEFQVNTFTTDAQGDPSVAMDSAGNFAITWTSSTQDPDGSGGIYAQRYRSDGTRLGGEFRVNDVVAGSQQYSAIAMRDNGYFAIAWQSSDGQDGDLNGIYFKEYNSDGQAQTTSVLANKTTAGNQRFPSITMDDDQDFVVIWSGAGIGDANGVFGRRFDTNFAPTAVTDVFTIDQDTPLTVPLGSSVLNNDQDDDGDAITAVLDTDVTNGLLSLAADGSFTYTPNPGFVGTDTFLYRANDGTSGGNAAKVLIHVNQTFATAAGGESRVNTTVADLQELPSATRRTIASDADGNYVVVWASRNQDAAGTWGIYAQRYDHQGNTIGGETLVNSTVAGDQVNPSVAMSYFGRFVVAWEAADANGTGIYAKAFDSDGTPETGQLAVNDQTIGNQLKPSVAMDDFGNFVIVWEGVGVGDVDGVWARRFKSNGQSLGGQFLANTATGGTQQNSAVSQDRTGDFVITWETDNSGDWDIVAQRFDNLGVKQGGEIPVHPTFTAGDQRYADVSMDAQGNFVVSWTSSGQDGSGNGVYAQRFAANGIPLGGMLQVNSGFTAGDQQYSSVSMNEAGEFAISWSSMAQDGDNFGVFAQEYAALGTARGAAVQVNTTTAGSQTPSSITLDNDRDFTVVWSGNGTGDADGIFVRRYETNLLPTAFDDTFGVDQGTPLTIAAPGVVANDPDPDLDPLSATLIEDVTNGALVLNVDGSFTYTPDPGFIGTDRFTYFADDGAFETGIATVHLVVGPPAGPVAGEFRANTSTTDDQDSAEVARDSAGNQVIVWTSRNQDGSGDGVYAQRYDADGAKIGGEFQVNVTTFDQQNSASVALDESGVMIFAWESEGQGEPGNDSNVYTRRFDFATAAPLTGEVLATTLTTEDQSTPHIALNSLGDYVITWSHDNLDQTTDIRGQRFDSTGAKVGVEFLVNEATQDLNSFPEAALADTGEFVVTWTGIDEDGFGIYARRFDSSATPVALGTPFTVSTSIATQFFSGVDMGPAGDFVVAWSSFGQDNDASDEGNVYFRRYDNSGNPLGDEVRVNSFTANSQWFGDVQVANDGSFVVAWSSFFQDGSFASVYAQQFDNNAMPVGAEFRANSLPGSFQWSPSLAMDAVGNYVIAWSGDGSGDTSGVFAQRYQVVPVADDEDYNVEEDGSLVIGAGAGVLVGDSDPNGQALAAVLVDDVSNGTLMLNSDGSFTYTPDPEFDGQDTFVYQANDGTHNSNYAVVTINVSQVNDAPLLDSSGSMTLAVNEDEVNPPGQTVAAIIASAGGDRIVDLDTAAEEGIAVTGATNPNGTWHYSTNGGAAWNSFGTLSDTSATLLDVSALVRFIPDPDFQGTGGTLTFRAWDHTAGSNGQTAVDVSINGGTTAYSTSSETATATVNNLNDAPVLTPASPALTSITEDQTANSGDTVSSFAAGSISDIDPGSLTGVAVTGSTNGNGTWEYSTDGGGSWSTVGPVSDSSALLLRASDRLRFVPDGLNADSATVTFRAWDQTSGAAGTQVDASVNGGTTAFSTATDTATITVTAVNDAPVLDNSGVMTLSDISEDAANPPGDTISAVIASAGGDRISDLDSGAVEGIAVSAVDNANGQWQYDAGGGWTVFGAVSDASATLLDLTASIRFVPNADYQGSAGNVTFRAWDQSDGKSSGDIGVDVSINGGTTAYSTSSETATATVNNLNDAPVLTPASPALTSITEDQTANSGDTVSSFAAGSISDIDPGSLTGVAVTGSTNGNGTWEYSTDGGGSWSTVGPVSDSSALLLRTSDRIRFVPDGLNADSATVTFRAWDQTSGAAGTQADASINGGLTAFSTATDTATITVTAVNDAPVLDNSGVMTLGDISEDAANPPGDTISAVVASAGGDRISDLDTGAVEGIAVTAVDNANGQWQYDAGGGWTGFGAVSDSSATLLDVTALIRFVPNADYQGSAGNITFRAWDQSDGKSSGDIGVDVSINGGTTAYSTSSETATATVNNLNDAPVLTPASPALTSITEDQTANSGDTVSSFAAGSISDIDPGSLTGVAVTGSTNGNGTWEYSTDGGGSWSTVGPVSDSSALLLRTSDRIRFVPDGLNADSATVTFRGWDQTGGAAGTQADASINGGTTAFSTSTDTATISVTAVNDAPTIATNNGMAVAMNSAGNFVTPAMLNEGDPDDNGTEVTYMVTSLPTRGTLRLGGTALVLNDTFTQDDIDNSLLTYNHQSNSTLDDGFDFSLADGGEDGTIPATGTFQITVLNAAPTVSLTNVVRSLGEDSDTATAIKIGDLVIADDGIGSNGLKLAGADAASFEIVGTELRLRAGTALDFESKASFAVTVEVDDTSVGGTPDDAANHVLAIIDVNERPVLQNIELDAHNYLENDGPAVLTTQLQASDDGSLLQGATIRFVSGYTLGEDILFFDGVGAIVGNWNAASGIMTLSGHDTVVNYETAIRSVTYQNNSEDPSAATRTIEFVVNDGQLMSAASVRSIDVTPVNDQPEGRDDSYISVGDHALIVAASEGVLANDHDLDDPLLVTAFVAPLNGTLIIQSDGSFAYTPVDGFRGVAHFTYVASDGEVDSAHIHVTIRVDGPPVRSFPVSNSVTEPAHQNQSLIGERSEDEEEEEEEEGGSAGADSVSVRRGPSAEKGESDGVPQINQTITVIDDINAFLRRDWQPLSSILNLYELEAQVVTPWFTFWNAEHSRNTQLRTLHTIPDGIVPQSIFVLETSSLIQPLDAMRDQVIASLRMPEWMAGSAIFTSVGLSAGSLLWSLRGGYAIASILSTMPAWTMLDPLPVLEYLDEENDEDGESLQSILGEKLEVRGRMG